MEVDPAELIGRVEEELGGLSTIQRILLATDGSVTSLLETLIKGRISIETLVQRIVPASAVVAQLLEVADGEEVNLRVVIMKEAATGRALMYARSYTPLSRLEPVFRSDLLRADIPIGRIMKRHRIEARREISAMEVLHADEELSKVLGIYQDEPLLSRRYCIIRHDKPLISIQEVFPARLFPERASVIVEAPSRLHLGLIEMSGALSRVDGGIGMALERPSTLLEARMGTETIVRGGDAATREKVRTIAERIVGHLGVTWKADITLHRVIPSHTGLGSGTSLALSTASALFRLAGRSCMVRSLAELTGRGGTSGIGTAVFEQGGFVIDGGHSFGPGKAKEDFRPSAASTGVYPAMTMVRHPFPEEWGVILVTPDVPPGASGRKEVDIFRSACPVPVEEVREICHEVLVRMIPGVVERDLKLFGAAVNRLQELGFKKKEIAEQAPVVRELMKTLRSEGAVCAGMSSFGPSVYAIAEEGYAHLLQEAREVMGEAGGDAILTSVRNSGAHFTQV
ncbi:MAG: beta-ribofuranosylaminobenzene 5'-phosphate synthase [Methanomicrobiales archaeon]|nr:beta-ribofuranosylaminobenzene 5'-phosphate synthase [Methanomicrobiales archaeon]